MTDWIMLDPKTMQQAIDEAKATQASFAWSAELNTGWAQYPQPPALTPEMFEDAIAHIEEHGWCQGIDVNHDGSVCLRGAFGKGYVVAEFSVFGVEQPQLLSEWRARGTLEVATRRVREVLQLMGVDAMRYRTLQHWNDEPGRTREQVIDGLTLAAKTLRERGA